MHISALIRVKTHKMPSWVGRNLSDTHKAKLRVVTKHIHSSEEYRIKIGDIMKGGYWYGNVTYRPTYCELWTPDLRERTRAFFNYRCVECGKPQNGKKLCVHHVHYNKKTCCDGSPRDLVALCVSCHSATNTHRDYWEKHFTEILKINFGGKCFFTKDEINENPGLLQHGEPECNKTNIRS